jgi:hypothetical protein
MLRSEGQMEHEATYLITSEDLLRIEKALRGSSQWLDRDSTPPTVLEDVQNGLRLVESIRGR